MKTALFDAPLRKLKDDFLYMPKGVGGRLSMGIELASVSAYLRSPADDHLRRYARGGD